MAKQKSEAPAPPEVAGSIRQQLMADRERRGRKLGTVPSNRERMKAAGMLRKDGDK